MTTKDLIHTTKALFAQKKDAYALVAACAIIAVGGTTLALHDNPKKPAPYPAPRPAATAPANTKTSAPSEDPTPSSPPVRSTAHAVASSTVKPPAAKPQPPTLTPKTGGQLILSHTSITIQLGQRFSGLTVRADNGAIISMPMLNTPPLNNSFSVGFAAAPDKPVWTGDIVPGYSVTPGIYTVTIISEARDRQRYQGTLTIHVVGQPRLEVLVLSTGNIGPYGYREVRVAFNNIGNHSEDVTLVEIMAEPEDIIDCIAGGHGLNHYYIFFCGAAPGQSGTITGRITAGGNTFTGSTTINF